MMIKIFLRCYHYSNKPIVNNFFLFKKFLQGNFLAMENFINEI
jgi:hypothetical protein